MTDVGKSTFQRTSAVAWREMKERTPDDAKAATVAGYAVCAIGVVLLAWNLGTGGPDTAALSVFCSPLWAGGFLLGTAGAISWKLYGHDAKMKNILRSRGLIGLDGDGAYDKL